MTTSHLDSYPSEQQVELGLTLMFIGATRYFEAYIMGEGSLDEESFEEESPGDNPLTDQTEDNPTTDWEQIPGVEGKYPSTDPSQPPGPDWEWRPKENPPGGVGSWYNSEEDESLYPNLEHPPGIDPHYDYKDSDGKKWRVFEDGRKEPK